MIFKVFGALLLTPYRACFMTILEDARDVCARVAELVDARDLKSLGPLPVCAGSTPAPGIFGKLYLKIPLKRVHFLD